VFSDLPQFWQHWRNEVTEFLLPNRKLSFPIFFN
jgi:hypothetical protein